MHGRESGQILDRARRGNFALLQQKMPEYRMLERAAVRKPPPKQKTKVLFS